MPPIAIERELAGREEDRGREEGFGDGLDDNAFAISIGRLGLLVVAFFGRVLLAARCSGDAREAAPLMRC